MGPLLVLVPCRNEALVIERKLANLAGCDWPASTGPHRVVVVDDGSTDGTGERAAALGAALDLALTVVPNDLRPGKSGAIARGLRERRGEELIVLTDADVALERLALMRLAEAFGADERLGMACGAQRFVTDLEHLPEARDAAGLYDRWTAGVRALESHFGRLVSVHGQLLAWRAELELEPTPGMAADDLDLMLQARSLGARIARVGGAVFYERRPSERDEREAQALRRARAYVQFLDHPRIAELSRRGGALARLQGLFYRTVPTATPRLVPLGLLAVSGLALITLGPLAAGLVVALAFAVLATPVGRRLIALLRVIVTAVRSAGGMEGPWETARH